MSLNLFGNKKFVIGVVHLLPLPGSPSYGGDIKQVFERALKDADELLQGGVDGIIVENLVDAPFTAGSVKPHVVAFMSLIASKIVERAKDRPVGVNVLRNDAMSALSIAYASGASFIRVNVLTGAMVTDQGIIQGNAYQLLRYRKLIGAEHIKIFADVLVKHAHPLGVGQDIVQTTSDTYGRGGADAIIVTGSATGASASPDDVKKIKENLPEVPVIVGSGVNPQNVCKFRSADGFIVGTYFKDGGVIDNPVKSERVRRLIEEVKKLE